MSLPLFQTTCLKHLLTRSTFRKFDNKSPLNLHLPFSTVLSTSFIFLTRFIVNSCLNMQNIRYFFLLAIIVSTVTADCHPDLWSVCDALNKAQSIGIPGGAGTCSTVCQVDGDKANFELKCSLSDDTKCAAESGLYLLNLKL